jgi:hypothetical protein
MGRKLGSRVAGSKRGGDWPFARRDRIC